MRRQVYTPEGGLVGKNDADVEPALTAVVQGDRVVQRIDENDDAISFTEFRFQPALIRTSGEVDLPPFG